MTDNCQCCMDMEMDVGETYDPAFITRHNSTTGRDANDCHPMSAITGLPAALDAKMDDSQIDTESLTDSDAKIPSSALTKAELAGKVDKVDGKGLSENDYTDADKAKLAAIEAGAEVNVIETVKVNGSALTPTDKAVDVPVPTKTSDISNDSGFITKAVDDLTNYYLKSQTYTRAEIEALLSIRLKFAIVQTLPAAGDADTIYLVPAASPQTGNVRDEYIYINDAWELIGSTEFVLTISQDATGIEINGTALQEASASQPGLMTAAQVTALAGKADVGDAYTKAEADTLLAGKVSGSGNIGTDLKPIIIVNGVATAVANPLVDTASNQDNISGRKTFTPDNGAITLVGTGSGNTHPVFAVRMTSLPDGADPPGGIWGGLQYLNSASKEVGSVTFNRSTNGDSYVHIFVKNSNNLNTGFKVYKTLAGDNYATSPSRTYNSANVNDVVTQGSLASNPEVVHTTGNETIAGIKQFEPGNGSVRVARTHNGNGFDVKALDYDVTEHSNTQYLPSAIAVYDKNDELYYQIRAVQNSTGEVSVYLRVRNADGTKNDILLGAGNPPASP